MRIPVGARFGASRNCLWRRWHWWQAPSLSQTFSCNTDGQCPNNGSCEADTACWWLQHSVTGQSHARDVIQAGSASVSREPNPKIKNPVDNQATMTAWLAAAAVFPGACCDAGGVATW